MMDDGDNDGCQEDGVDGVTSMVDKIVRVWSKVYVSRELNNNTQKSTSISTSLALSTSYKNHITNYYHVVGIINAYFGSDGRSNHRTCRRWKNVIIVVNLTFETNSTYLCSRDIQQ